MKIRAERFLTVEQAAQRAGVTVSTMRYWLYLGRLPSVRPGRRRMVSAEALALYLTSTDLTRDPQPVVGKPAQPRTGRETLVASRLRAVDALERIAAALEQANAKRGRK